VKKFFIVALVIGFGFFSCTLNPDTTVINHSSFPITFRYSFYDSDKKTLGIGDSVTLNHFFTDLIILSPVKRVTQKRDSGVITVSDLPALPVHVLNNSTDSVTLSADEWMDDIPVSGSENIHNDTHKVYTDTPTFTVTPALASNGSFFNVQWQLIDPGQPQDPPYFYVVISD